MMKYDVEHTSRHTYMVYLHKHRRCRNKTRDKNNARIPSTYGSEQDILGRLIKMCVRARMRVNMHTSSTKSLSCNDPFSVPTASLACRTEHVADISAPSGAPFFVFPPPLPPIGPLAPSRPCDEVPLLPLLFPIAPSYGALSGALSCPLLSSVANRGFGLVFTVDDGEGAIA